MHPVLQHGAIIPYFTPGTLAGELPCSWFATGVQMPDFLSLATIFMRVNFDTLVNPLHTWVYVEVRRILPTPWVVSWSRKMEVWDWNQDTINIPFFASTPTPSWGDLALDRIRWYRDSDDLDPNIVNRLDSTPWDSCPGDPTG